MMTYFLSDLPCLSCIFMGFCICVCDRVDGVMDAQGFERSYTVNSSILLAIQPHLIHFHQLLLRPLKVHNHICRFHLSVVESFPTIIHYSCGHRLSSSRHICPEITSSLLLHFTKADIGNIWSIYHKGEQSPEIFQT